MCTSISTRGIRSGGAFQRAFRAYGADGETWCRRSLAHSKEAAQALFAGE